MAVKLVVQLLGERKDRDQLVGALAALARFRQVFAVLVGLHFRELGLARDRGTDDCVALRIGGRGGR